MSNFNLDNLKWTNGQLNYIKNEHSIKIQTKAHTDLWQRTYYHFQNDNAPMLLMPIADKFFSFEVKTNFAYKQRFDQCGVVLYLDSENWLKSSIEYENQDMSHLGCVVTNLGFSDWSTSVISNDITSMYYRLSRREDDFCVQCSTDGVNYSQIRVCHLFKATDSVAIGIYACSPEESSFEASFSNFAIKECLWLKHDGQASDY